MHKSIYFLTIYLLNFYFVIKKLYLFDNQPAFCIIFNAIINMKKKFLLTVFTAFSLIVNSQTNYVWNGSTSTDWNTNTNWTPNGIPGSVDNATIVTGGNNCILAGNTNITNLTITSGILNLNSFTITSTGVVACNSGTCTNGMFNSTATSLTFAGTLMEANVNANVTEVYLNGSTFNGSVNVTKNGSINAQSNGNNIFNGVTSITNSGTGYLMLTNGAAGRNETFNGVTTLNTTNSGALYLGYSRNVTLNANVTINNTASTGIIQIGRIGVVNVSSGVTINCGTFAGATLNLYNIVQTGTTALNLAPGSNGRVNIYGSSFTGSLNVNAGLITAQTSTFSAATTYSVSGTINNAWSNGGNIYNGVLSVYNTSNGYTGFANGTGDTYNNDVYLTVNSTTGGRIIFGENSTSNFNGDIYVSQSGGTSASGIALGWNGAFPLINLAAGKSIFVNGAFSSGYLRLYKMQTSATSNINITTTGTSNVVLNNSEFGGSVSITTPDIYPYGGTYNGPVVFTKTGGGTSNHNNGNQNIFNSTLELNNQNGGGYILLSYQSNDQFNDNVTLTSTGAATGISLGWNSGTGAPVLAAGKTISIGAAGYSAGYLQLGSFTQLGSAPITLSLTGTATFNVIKPNIVTTIGGALDVTAPDIYIQGGTFNGATKFTKTGGAANHNNGNQNIFNSTLEINQQSSTGYFMLGYNSNDIFNDDITVTNTGTSGIYLGYINGTGSCTLASGKTISVGGAGFNNGFLYFGAFTQLGSAPVNLPLTGASTLTFRASNFGGNLTSTSGSYMLIGSTFNGVFNATKTGTTNDPNSGGNTFNGVCNITNNGSGYFGMAWSNPDTWNNDVTFVNTGSGRILPGWIAAGNIFNGNINLTSTGSSTGIHFCGNSATATATMTAGHTINTTLFDKGYLILNRFTQLGNVPVNLNLTSTANYLTYGPTSTFGGNVTSTSPGLFLNGCNFNGTTNITKTGSTGDYSDGGNIFNGVSYITNSGSNFLLMGNILPDIWNDDVTFTNNGSERLLPAWTSVGNQFNGNIYVNTSGSAQGISFCGGNATATATLAATKTIASGTVGLNSGYLVLKQFTQLGNAPINLTLNSGSTYLQFGPLSKIGGNVTSVSPRLFFNGCTFDGTVNCTKNGAVNDQSSGLNIFNGSSIMTNSGSGYLMFGNGNSDQFNNNATFNNNGSSYMYIAYNSTGNVFNGTTTFNNAPTTAASKIFVAAASSGNSIFNGNIIVTNVNGAGVDFGSGTGTSTLSAGNTISIGGAGFNSGNLILKQFTQLGSTPQSLTTTGTSIITYGPTARFDGNVTSVSPRLYFNGCTFNGTTNCTKNGASHDNSNGSNIFVGTSTITNSGSGYLMLGDVNTDVFMSDVLFRNLGTNHLYVAHNSSNNIFNGVVTFSNSPSSGNFGIYVSGFSAGTQFNENIIVSSVNGSGVQFCYGNATATSTLAAGKTITIGPGGFNTGTLMLKQFTQLGSTAQTLSLTAGTAQLQLGPLSRFDGAVDFTFPQVLLHGATYNNTANIIKNGASDNAGNGGNIFNGTTNITNSGSGYLMTGNSTSDQFNGNTTFNNTGSFRFYFAHNHAGQTTTFTQPLTINSNKSGGTDGWSYFICEGTNANVSFNDVTINVLGTRSSYVRLLQGANSTATFNGDLTVNLNNTFASGTQVHLGVTGTTTYNGNITLNSTTGVTGSGIFFNMTSTSSSTLASTKSIGLGGSGFTSGSLSLARFTQLGAASQTLNQVTGTAILTSGPSSIFNGPVDFNFPQINLHTTTYNNSADIEKNGATNSPCFGGNTFNGTTTITNSHASNYLLLANGASDSYNGDVTMTQSGAGPLHPNYNFDCTYGGNISVSSPAATAITFGGNTGVAILNNGNSQSINRIGSSAIPIFRRLTVNKSANDVTLNTKVFVSIALTLTQGIVNTTQTNILHLTNNTSTNIGNNTSFINGPMNYDMALNGARTLTFPIGKVADWRPAVLGLSHNNATSYTYNSEVTNSDAHLLGWAYPPTANMSSHVHWWDITRSNTSTGVNTPTLHLNGNQTVTLYYDTNDGVTDPTNLTILKNTSTAPTSWIDIGGTGATMGSGSVASTSSPSAFNSFSRFTLGNKVNGTNPLPIELLYFTAIPVENKIINLDWATASESNNHHFEIERSIDGVNFEYLTTVKAKGNGNSVTKQEYNTVDKKPYKGISYYRLKQVDISGTYEYAKIVAVEITDKSFINFFPNPAVNTINYTASEDYETATIKILNNIGAEVMVKNNIGVYNGSIDVSNLASGIYYIVLQKGEEIKNIKFSVQK
jgi:hypothetical protein